MNPLRTTLSLALLVAGLLAASTVLARTDSADGPIEALGPRSTTSSASSASSPAPVGTGSPEGSTSGTRPATGLDPGLEAAFERARAAAADAGHTLVINSGYRTAERQQELLDEAVAKHGSWEEASRWVFTPDRSMHVQGLAFDVGDGPAADWLDANGAAYGICHTLAWEWWHFEWRAAWETTGTCPPEAQDPSQAPGR